MKIYPAMVPVPSCPLLKLGRRSAASRSLMLVSIKATPSVRLL